MPQISPSADVICVRLTWKIPAALAAAAKIAEIVRAFLAPLVAAPCVSRSTRNAPTNTRRAIIPSAKKNRASAERRNVFAIALALVDQLTNRRFAASVTLVATIKSLANV